MHCRACAALLPSNGNHVTAPLAAAAGTPAGPPSLLYTAHNASARPAHIKPSAQGHMKPSTVPKKPTTGETMHKSGSSAPALLARNPASLQSRLPSAPALLPSAPAAHQPPVSRQKAHGGAGVQHIHILLQEGPQALHSLGREGAGRGLGGRIRAMRVGEGPLDAVVPSQLGPAVGGLACHHAALGLLKGHAIRCSCRSCWCCLSHPVCCAAGRLGDAPGGMRCRPRQPPAPHLRHRRCCWLPHQHRPAAAVRG